jgi:hypothetical protein
MKMIERFLNNPCARLNRILHAMVPPPHTTAFDFNMGVLPRDGGVSACNLQYGILVDPRDKQLDSHINTTLEHLRLSNNKEE